METQTLGPLGRFAKLAPEIRLLVWESLFSSCKILARAPNRPRVESKNLSILCVSRRLYEEISYHLYRRLKHRVRLSPVHSKQQWMTVQISSRGLSVIWVLENITDARRHLETFPHNKAHLRVEIFPPAQSDPGQIVLLWEKVNVLVDILIQLSGLPAGCPCVLVRLIGCWRDTEIRAKETITRTNDRIPPREYCPDHDIVVLPFSRLDSRWYYGVPKGLCAILNDELNDPRTSVLSLSRKNQLPIKDDGYNLLDKNGGLVNLDQWLMETGIFIDASLDDIPGKTANMLRLERFGNWFVDGESWESPYEKWLLSIFPTNFDIIQKYDARLTRASRRHKMLMIFHHCGHMLTNRPEPPRLIVNGELYTSWSSGNLYTVYPNGIRGFDTWQMQETVRRHGDSTLRAYRKGVEQVSQFSDALRWWEHHGADVINNRISNHYYSCCVCETRGSPCRWCIEYDCSRICLWCVKFKGTG